MEKFTINQSQTSQRLDKFLVGKLEGLSRSQIQKMIKRGLVTLNGKSSKVHEFLKAGDEIHVTYNLKPETQEKKDTDISQNLSPRIIFEDNNFIIVEKPCGLLVHETEKKEPYTLVAWLLQKYPELKSVGEEKYRAGIIHRLDKDVSGVMVVVKTQAMYEHLKNQFKERKVKKEYLALVYGHMPEYEGKIEIPIGRRKDGKFVAHPRIGWKMLQENDKHATTIYKVLEQIKNYDHLSIQILTGRTHQIRVHLQYLGHPIVGDTEYGPKKSFLRFFARKIKVVEAPRLMLHSHTIGFYNLQNEWVEFESPLPHEIKDFLIR